MRIHREGAGSRLGRWAGWVAVSALAMALLHRVWNTSGASPDAVWAAAEEDLRAGRIERAEAGIARLGRLREPVALDWFLRARVALARGRNDEAIADLEHVPDGHNVAARARLLAGQIELTRKRVRRAEDWFQKAIQLDPKHIQARKELVFIHGLQHRLDELNREYTTLSELTALTYEEIRHWCLAINPEAVPDQTVDVLRSWVEADPDDRWSRLALADNLRRLGRFDVTEKTLATLPEDDADACAIRARVAFDRGDDPAAEKLLASGPERHAELARMRGRLALGRRDGASAVMHFRIAYQIAPDDRESIVGLGQALAMSGDQTAAASFLDRSRDHDALVSLLERVSTPAGRNDKSLPRALGLACERVGRLPEARSWLAVAIAGDPLDKDAQKALYRINLRRGSPADPVAAK